MSVVNLPTGVDQSDAVAIQEVPKQIIAAWANHDADAFAAVFAENGSMILPNNVFRRGRDEIQSYMAGAFAGPYRDTQLTGEPMDARFLAADVALVITRGGVLGPGETAVAPERGVLATWVLSKLNGEWKLDAYQNPSTATG